MSYSQQQFNTSSNETVAHHSNDTQPQSNSEANYSLNEFQPTGVYSGVFEDHGASQNNLRIQMSHTQMNSVEAFQAHYLRHQQRYEAVSARSQVPAPLIAAIHWRESTGDFGTYLHQGDPLGRPAVNEPRNIPVFYKWEEGAVHALQMKDFIRTNIGIDSETRHFAALATYAEAYNGLGYHLYKGMESPYVYAGTNHYSQGKYISDGSFSSWHVDQQPGIASLLGAVDGADAPSSLSPRLKSKEDAWLNVVDGADVLKMGSHGDAVEILQQRLDALGFPNGPDGDFGPNTKRLVIEFQNANGLTADGVVGRGTAGAIEMAYSERSEVETG
ncbi:MAG: peptidoglycan-binding protein [Myxococcota bacterium]|nr:peptidoglycan-binding protein [Myxococcota bacterium]